MGSENAQFGPSANGKQKRVAEDNKPNSAKFMAVQVHDNTPFHGLIKTDVAHHDHSKNVLTYCPYYTLHEYYSRVIERPEVAYFRFLFRPRPLPVQPIIGSGHFRFIQSYLMLIWPLPLPVTYFRFINSVLPEHVFNP